jgi:N-acetylglucosamine-6-phosphate deacetylase
MQSTVRARRLLTAAEAIEYPEITLEDGKIVRVEAGALDRLAGAIEAGASEGTSAATPVGLHLEGPFVSEIKRGVHPVASLLAPDLDTFDRFQQAARGHIRLMTIAPELAGAVALIEHATAAGVRISMGHSNATEQEALAGIRAGAVSATHAFNAMRSLDHREPGVLGVVLDQQELYAEAICDGVHVHPLMIRLWLKMKGSDRAILITDGMSATGMPDGEYTHGRLCRAGEARCVSSEREAGGQRADDGCGG